MLQEIMLPSIRL